MLKVKLATRRLVRTHTDSSQHSVPFHAKNHSYERKEVEDYCYQFFVRRSSVSTGLQKMLQKWCVITLKMNDNLTQHFIGTPLGRYCWKRSQNMEHEISQTDNGFDLFMKEAARQELSIVRIPKIPWLTFEQFKETRVEFQLTRSWWSVFEFLSIGRGFFITGFVLSPFSQFLRSDWLRVDMKAISSIYPGEWTDSGWSWSSHHLIPLVEILKKKNVVMITQFLKKFTTTVIANEIKMLCTV